MKIKEKPPIELQPTPFIEPSYICKTDCALGLWVYFNSKTDLPYLLGKYTGNPKTSEYLITYDQDTDRLQFSVFANTEKATVSADSFGTVPLHEWLFVVAWRNSTSNTLNIQINNGLTDTVSWTGRVNVIPGNPVVIGGNGFNGRIANLLFEQSLLTLKQRTDLFKKGNGLSFFGELFSTRPAIENYRKIISNWWTEYVWKYSRKYKIAK